MALPAPYQHQLRSVDAVRKAYVNGARRVCVVLPTGAGKTVTACMVVDSAIKKGRRVLFLAHREELVDQAAKSLARIGVEHGIVKAGRVANPNAPIQVASVQTLAARPQAMPPADIIIPDETHHAVARTWRDILGRYPRPELVMGLTATPERADRSPLGDIYQHLVAVTSIAELQRTPINRLQVGGPTILVPCSVVGPARYQRELSEPPMKALLRARRADGSLRPTVVFTSSVEEAYDLDARARAAGLRSVAVDGKLDAAVRRERLEAFAEGRADVVWNNMLLTEGWDAPRAEVCIIARGCASAATYLQMVGRVLRACPGTQKRSALLIDLRGAVHVHGLPDDERTYSLEGRAIEQVERIPVKQCMTCGACFRPATACPACGTPTPRDLRANKVRHAPLALVTSTVSVAEKRAYFDDLLAQARRAGWKPKAVGVRFRLRFGHWPLWPLEAP